MPSINIIYKVDKSQLDASTASVEKAKAATDQLNSSAAKLGSAGAKSTINFGNTIEGVRLKMQQLKAQIDLTNQSDTKRLNGLISQYKQAQKTLEQYNSKLKEQASASNQAAKSTGGLNTNYSALLKTLGAIATLAFAKQLLSMTLDAAKLAGQVEGVERAFNRAFPASVLVLNDLRKATQGTVSDFDLMKKTLQATNLGISIEGLPKLFELATVRAQQTGESVEYLTDSIVSGIGRKSSRVIDNLGISASRLKEKLHGVGIESVSVAEFTKIMSDIAKEELDKMGGYVETSATKVERLGVSWANLGVEIAKLTTQKGGVVDYFTGLVNRFGDLAEAMNKGISISKLYHDRAVLEAAQAGINILKLREFTGEKENDLRVTKEVIAEKTHELIQLQEQTKALKERQIALLKLQAIENVGPEFRSNKESITQQGKEQELLIAQIKLLKGLAAQQQQNDVADKESLGIIAKKREEIKALNEELENTSKLGDLGFDGKLVKAIKKAQDELDKLLGKVEKSSKEKPTKIEIKFVKKTGSDFLKDLDINIPKIELPLDIEIVSSPDIISNDFFDNLTIAFNKRKQDFANEGFNIAQDQIASLQQAELESYDKRIKDRQNFYTNQIALAGDNDKAKIQLEIKRNKELAILEKQRNAEIKRAALKTILINTAIGVVKALATSLTIYDGLVQAAFVAATGASQYAIASRAGYKDGVIDLKGPGTMVSDSIPVNLSRGESVMTGQETLSSKKTLQLIRAKKLNDKILDRIMAAGGGTPTGVGFDDSRLLEATKQVARAAAGNDIIRKGSIIYEAKQEGASLKKYIRSKTLN